MIKRNYCQHLFGCQPPLSMSNGENRGSTQAYDATMGNTDVALQGIISDAYHLIYNNKAENGSGYKREGKELADHTVVRP